jgi:hypothetical protein
VKIYLASRYSRRLELCAYRSAIEAAGHTVTSRWLNGGHEVPEHPVSDVGPEAAEDLRTRFAMEDWADLMSAECCIAFTEPPRTGPSRGGRHVELGGALAAGKRVIIVGHRENVFCCMPQVEFWSHFNAMLVLSLKVEPEWRNAA